MCFVVFSARGVLSLLHIYIYIVVLALGAYNPCNRGYLLHVPLCLSIAWAIALKLGKGVHLFAILRLDE